MANTNIRIPASGTISISKGTGKKITLTTKDKYVPEDIDIHVKPQVGSFANSASNGVTYSEETNGNTVIASNDGYLYLNAGWFNDTKISLGHLIPDIATNDATDNHIRTGFKAYNENGELITGVMDDQTPQFDGGDLTINPVVDSLTAPTVNVTISGKFAPETDGENTLVSGGLGQLYGVTTTAISGTEGTEFLSIDAERSVTNGSVKAKVTYSREAVLYNGAVNGYVNVADNTVALQAITQTSSITETATTITPAVSDKFPKLYIPIVKSIEGTGGGVSQGTSSASATIDTTEVTSTTNFTYPTSTNASTYGIIELSGTGPVPDNSVSFKSTAGGSVSADGTASIQYTREVVTLNGDAKGAINKASGTTLLSGSGIREFTTPISGSSNVSKTGTTYYIPVVTPVGTGGGVTKADASGSVTGEKPNVEISSSASTSATETYGFLTESPGGDENSDFVKVTTTGMVGEAQTWSGTATIQTKRAAVKYDDTYKGLISKGTSDIFLTEDTNAGTVTHTISGSVKSTINSETSEYTSNYYVPIAEPTIEGGDLSMSQIIGMTGNDTLTVGTKVTFNKVASSTDDWTDSVTVSTFGITITEPDEGRDGYVRILPGQNGNNQTTTISASISANVNPIIMNKDAGVSRKYNNETIRGASNSVNASGSKSVKATASDGIPYYIPIVTVSGTLTPTNSITLPKYSSNSSASFNTAINSSTNVPGFLTDAPSSGNYITITPSTSYTPGSVTSSVQSVTISAGLTSGGTLTGASDEDTISATNQGATAKYIAVYEGGHTVVDL